MPVVARRWPRSYAARVRVSPILVALGILIATACGDGGATADPARNPSTNQLASTASAESSTTGSRRSPNDRPLPAFEGTTLAGDRLSATSLLGKRALLFFFDPAQADAAIIVAAIQTILPFAGDHNFRVVGIGGGSSRGRIERFVEDHRIEFPVVDDSTGAISRRIGLREPIAVVGVDAEGYFTFGFDHVPPDPATATKLVELQLRQSLRIPEQGDAADPLRTDRPAAPEFRGVTIDGESVDSASFRGRPIALVFFLHTCPHCHHLLEFLKKHLPTIPEAQRPVLLGVSVSDDRAAVRAQMKSDGLDFFPILVDPDLAIRNAYGVIAGVPDLFLISADRKIHARTQGWRDDRDPPLLEMRLARLVDRPVPMLLHKTGFSGNEFCAVCHPKQQDTWLLTNHAGAFETLVKHGADKNAECVSCHVVGFGKSGGYAIASPARELEDVGCESCHGRGGPHLSPGLVSGGDYQPQCVQCHDPKHSLGFSYAEFLPRVSHAANAQLAAQSPEEKRRILAARRAPRENLLPTRAAYVGSKACESCHASEYATWSKGPHAHAMKTLEKAGKAGDAACLRCHTTGYGRTGGFPAGSKAPAQSALSDVGCESCHGPGGEHVAEGSAKSGTIVALADKCDSCVILQICGSCHDAANDPGFEFEVKQKIEAQKHGTKTPPSSARRTHDDPMPRSARLGLLERAFALTGQRG